MKLDEFRDGLETVNVAYREVVDQMAIEDPGAEVVARDTLGIWWEALGTDYEFLSVYEDSVLRDLKSITMHKDTVAQLEAALRQREYRNVELASGYLFSTLQTYVLRAQQKAKDRAARSEGAGAKEHAAEERNDYRRASLLLSRMNQIDLSNRLRTALNEARAHVKEAETAATNAKVAAGVASGARLTARFAALSKAQLCTSTLFRWLTAVFVVIGIGGTYWIAFGLGASHPGSATTGDAIIRVSLLGAVLGLATYFGRQAGYHRDIGTWAKTIEEQLLTFEGYLEPIGDAEIRDGMRAAFAARVFGSSPDSKDDVGVTLGSSFMSELMTALKKSAESAAK